MTFSTKQLDFATYMLMKIGFSDEKLISSYLSKLESIYGRMEKEWYWVTNRGGYTNEYYNLKYTVSDCIEILLEEIELKKNPNKIKVKHINHDAMVTATDLASFNYCPTAYSISKSFEIEKPTNEDKRLNGIKLHETLRLINKKIPDYMSESDLVIDHVLINEKIQKIKNCKLIYSGHTEAKKYFINKSKNYVGQPDYIFEDTNGVRFAVEEKFRFVKTRNEQPLNTSFFSNHIVQLQSYIDFIEEFDLQYGILIYWYYDIIYDYPQIHNFAIKIIRKNEYQILLNNTLDRLNDFNKKKVHEVGANHPNKCAACVVNKYCVHKTNTLNSVNLPYDIESLRLKNIPFPNSLKK